MQGLMRTVESRTKDGRKAWEGFISGMQMHLPGITFEVNLKDAFNECFASYTLISSSILTRTNTQQDDFLQSKYGAKQGPLSIANIQSAGMADQAVTNFLEKYKDPYRLISSFPNSSNTIGMTVFCEGFWHTNFWHIYNQTALATNIGLSDLIKLIISDVTEFVLFEDIASNSTIVTRVYDADRMAGSIMEGLAALGDAGNNRYIIGMTDDRTFYYKKAKPISDEGYSMTATTDPKRISDANGKEVPKPLVRPDNWIRYPDVSPANLGQAGLKMYIESVAYNENADGIEEVGIDTSRSKLADVQLARITDGGVYLA